MKNLELNTQNDWRIMAMFHQSNINKIKEKTGAYHVCHIKDFREGTEEKTNCLHIKGKAGEAKYGGTKPFSEWTNEDYQNILKSYTDEFKTS